MSQPTMPGIGRRHCPDRASITVMPMPSAAEEKRRGRALTMRRMRGGRRICRRIRAPPTPAKVFRPTTSRIRLLDRQPATLKKPSESLQNFFGIRFLYLPHEAARPRAERLSRGRHPRRLPDAWLFAEDDAHERRHRLLPGGDARLRLRGGARFSTTQSTGGHEL